VPHALGVARLLQPKPEALGEVGPLYPHGHGLADQEIVAYEACQRRADVVLAPGDNGGMGYR
jgi:hypothetical protein